MFHVTPASLTEIPQQQRHYLKIITDPLASCLLIHHSILHTVVELVLLKLKPILSLLRLKFLRGL